MSFTPTLFLFKKSGFLSTLCVGDDVTPCLGCAGDDVTSCLGCALGANAYWSAAFHLYTPLPFRPGRGFGDLFRTHLFVNAGNLSNIDLGQPSSRILPLLFSVKICKQIPSPPQPYEKISHISKSLSQCQSAEVSKHLS